MKRRHFITLVGGAAVAWPLAAGGQESRQVRLVGILHYGRADDPVTMAEIAAFKEALRRLEWIEGRNIRFEERLTPPILRPVESLPRNSSLLRPM